MDQDELDEIAATGERLPLDMVFDPGLLTEREFMQLPVFDGQKVVDRVEG